MGCADKSHVMEDSTGRVKYFICRVQEHAHVTMDTSKPKNIGLKKFFDFVSGTATTSIEDGPAGVSFCHICEEYIPSANDEEHYQSQCHQRSWNEFCSRIENILEIRDDAVNITRTIPQVHWQNRIYECIGRAVATDDKTLMERAKQLRSWYKHLECISLLELALWKFWTSINVQTSHIGWIII